MAAHGLNDTKAWQEFRDVKQVMAEEERELSTDEEEVEVVPREALLEAADVRLRRDSETQPRAHVPPGHSSAAFDDRARDVFGTLGTRLDGDAPQLRFWTSLHTPGLGASSSAREEGAEDAEMRCEEEDTAAPWQPLDDIESLSGESEDLEEEHGAGAENLSLPRPPHAKRGREEQQRGPGESDGNEHGSHTRSVRRVRFGGVETVEYEREEGHATDDLWRHGERPGYTHYTLDDDEEDLESNSSNARALRAAFEAVRASHAEPEEDEERKGP